MTTTPIAAPPILVCAESMTRTLAEVAAAQPVFLTTTQKEQALVGLMRVESQVRELRLRIMATADDVADAHGARDVATWLARETKAEPRHLAHDLALARALDRSHQPTAAAFGRGEFTPTHAQVIVDSIAALPDHVEPEIKQRAELNLIDLASDFRPSELRRLGRHILDAVAPEIADDEEAKRLQELEDRAKDGARLWFTKYDEASTRVTAILPDAVAARLRTYLEAFTSPRQHGSIAPVDRLPVRRQYADAFAALLERIDPNQLPRHGGDATTLLVTVSLEDLRRDIASAGLLDADTTAGPNLTANEARRLACNAAIIPVVLGGRSEPLDLGRGRRLFSPPQVKAMRLRDKTCRADDCDVPAAWCEAHHLSPWSKGGKTDLTDGVLYCRHHHQSAHDPRFRVEILRTGEHRFHRRA